MTVSEQIIQVIDALCEKFGIAVNWTSENVIPYLEILCGKLVKYEICTSIAWITIMVLLSLASIVATKKLTPKFKKGCEDEADTWDNGWHVGAAFAIIGLIGLNLAVIIVVGKQVMDIIKCATFPEMYIFEYISALLK